MQRSLEAFFLVNLVVDTALIAVVARANECMRLRRVLLAGFLAASYALLVQEVSGKLAHPAIQTLLLGILGMILCGEPEMQCWGPVSAQLLGGTLIIGGAGALFYRAEGFPAALIGAGLILVGVVFGARCRRMFTWDVELTITLKGKAVSFRALIDTGNRLHEPISGLPVLIVEYGLLSALFTHLHIDSLPCRRVSFGALGGGGTVRCFRPDAVLIRRGKQFVRAPDVWVAAYPGRIPGAARALAPPSFAVIQGRMHCSVSDKNLSKRGDI